MYIEKRKPALIEHIHGLDPNLHVPWGSQPDIPAVIGQLGRRIGLGPAGTGAQVVQQADQQHQTFHSG